MDESTAQTLIEEQLHRLQGWKRYAGSDCFVICPFHTESKPSCGVCVSLSAPVPVGYFYCMGCGEKGHWNKFAEQAGLEKLPDDFRQKDLHYTDKELGKINSRLLFKSMKMPAGIVFDRDKWRGVDGDLMREVGTVIAKGQTNGGSKIYAFVPVKVHGETIAILQAAMKRSGKQNPYIYLSDSRLKQRGLFPFDKTLSMLKTGNYKAVFIVEGPRDALNLIQHDMPALSIISATQWGKAKNLILSGMCMNYDVTPIVMMDGDIAGKKIQRKVVADLGERVHTEQVKLWVHGKKLGRDDLDPANLPDNMIAALRKLAVKEVTNGKEK